MGVLDNLLANAKLNNMLNPEGAFRQYDYYQLWLNNLRRQNPTFDTAANLITSDYSSSDSDYTQPIGKAWHEMTDDEKYLETVKYYNDDILSGKNIMGAVGMAIPGVKTLTEYDMGQNVVPDITSFAGGMLGGRLATNPLDAMLYSNLGGFAGDIAGRELAKGGVFGEEYKGQWTDKYKGPGSRLADALGYKVGSPERDLAIQRMMEFGNKEDIEEELLKAEKDLVASYYEPSNQPVEIEDRSWGYGVDDPDVAMPDESFEQNMSVPSVEPYTVNDFTGMFSGISETVDQAISGVSDWWDNLSFESKPAPLTYAEQMSTAYGAESDPYGKGYEAFGSEGDATSRDDQGTVWHSSDYNWNTTDGGASAVSGGTDFSPSSDSSEDTNAS